MPNNSSNIKWIENKSRCKSVLLEISDAISAYRAAYKDVDLNQIGWWFHSSSTNFNGWTAINTSLSIDGDNLVFGGNNAEIISPPLLEVPPFFAKQPIGSNAHKYFKIRCKATKNTKLTFYFKREFSLEEAYFTLNLEENDDYVISEIDMSGFEDWAGNLESIKIKSRSEEPDAVVLINYIMIDKESILYDLSDIKNRVEFIKQYSFQKQTETSILTEDLIKDIRAKIQKLNQTPLTWSGDIVSNQTFDTHLILSDLKAKIDETENRNYGWMNDCDAYNCTCNQTCYEQGGGCTCDTTCYQEATICNCDGVCHGESASCTCDVASYGFSCPCDRGSECNGYSLSCNCDNYMTCSCYNECHGDSHSCSCDGECYGDSISCTCDFETYGFSCPCNDSSTCNADTGSGCSQDWDMSCSCYSECYGYSQNCNCDGECYGDYMSCDCDLATYGFSCPCNTGSACNADTGSCNCDTHMTCTCYSECYEESYGCDCDGECYGQGADCTCDGECYLESYNCQCDQQKYQESCWTCHNYIP